MPSASAVLAPRSKSNNLPLEFQLTLSFIFRLHFRSATVAVYDMSMSDIVKQLDRLELKLQTSMSRDMGWWNMMETVREAKGTLRSWMLAGHLGDYAVRMGKLRGRVG